MRLLVLGAGAVGGYFGGRLAEAGQDAAIARLGASIAGQDGTLNAMLEQRAMVAQHQRTADRVRKLEEERS